jgi:Holliday junction resolvase
MRFKLKRDEFHTQIANQLTEAGFSVHDTSRVGGGFPDLAIARNNVSAHVELKTPRGRKTALERRSAGQIEFANTWRGPIIVAYSASEIVHDFNLLIKRRGAYAVT